MAETSGEIDRVDSVTLEGIDCALAPISAAAVDEVGIVFLELSQSVVEIGEGDVVGPWHVRHAPFHPCADIDDLEVRIVLVLFNQLFGLLGIDTHREKVIIDGVIDAWASKVEKWKEWTDKRGM